MTTKEKVYQALTEHPDGISGQRIAMKLGITRSAIWKAIKSLKEEGCSIEGITNRGYRLLKKADRIDAAVISALCGNPVEVFESINSTNLVAKERAATGAPHGTAIVAAAQSAGRGRHGRKFISRGSGIYMTVVLRPGINPASARLITPAVAVAVRDAIAEVCGRECGIKWVNDLYFNGKKVCGILTEAVTDVETGEFSAVVTGIGINYSGKTEDFPEELRSTAGFVFAPEDDFPPRNELAARIITNVLAQTENIEARAFLESYREHSTVIGQRVEYTENGQAFTASAVGIDENGGLEVVRDDGTRETIEAGEISVKVE